jgi:short-subunit dehydrogenase
MEKYKKSWLNQRNVIISGASSGIGREIAIILVRKFHCHVIGLARREELLMNLQQELGPNFSYHVLDVSLPENWRRLKKELDDQEVRVDILINNAGILHPFESFLSLEEKEINQVFNTNVFAHLSAIKTFLPDIIVNQGGIINICSAASYVGIPGMSVYGASKAAFANFTNALRYELPKGIYVGAIYPGFVQTELFKSDTNGQSYIQDEDRNFIHKFSKNAVKTAAIITTTMHHKRKHKTIGIDSFLCHLAGLFMPIRFGKVFKGIAQTSKLSTFRNIFSKKRG